MNFLKNTRDDILTLEADNSQELKWYVDAAYAVQPHMKIHTGAVFTLVKGAMFKVFRDLIMNLSGIIPRVGQQECVGHN